MAPREIENNAYAKFYREKKEYYGIFEKGLLECSLLVTISLLKLIMRPKSLYEKTRSVADQRRVWSF